tara:strand:+ start:203 stop:517 length:315 start_codon:yes stop_codon:yes gene_type:complete
MEISKLKQKSDRSYTIALEKQNALEKAKSRMLFAHNGHLFNADAETISLVKTLSEDLGTFVILDVNDNPVLIEDPKALLDALKSKNQEVLNSYHQLYKTITETR